MKTPIQKKTIVDQIMKDLKKSNLPLLSIDANIAHIKKQITKWEDARDNAQTPEKRASYAENVEICRLNLEDTILENKEIVDATMGIIRSAVRHVIDTIYWRYEHIPLYKCQNDYIVISTRREPFHIEAVEKFGYEIKFSLPIKGDSLRYFMISKLESRRSMKKEKLVRVYFQILNEPS